MKYNITIKYKNITASTQKEANSEEEAIRAAEKALLRIIRRKYPELKGGSIFPSSVEDTSKEPRLVKNEDGDEFTEYPRIDVPSIDAEITATLIPEPKPEDELASLESQKAEIEERIARIKNK
ncbi:MAG: hypothetical protein AVO39_10405 [delta proteobacterium MLS_D]|nr:MAG: hypothetical protein AVO39_10405 [delta proteobacterium MLS_D]